MRARECKDLIAEENYCTEYERKMSINERAGKAISEDTFVGNSVGAGNKSSGPQDFNAKANALYSNQQP